MRMAVACMVMPVAAAASVPCSETSTKALWTTSEIARPRFGSMPEKSALSVNAVGIPMIESALRRENSDSVRNFGRLTCTFRVARLPSQPVRYLEQPLDRCRRLTAKPAQGLHFERPQPGGGGNQLPLLRPLFQHAPLQCPIRIPFPSKLRIQLPEYLHQRRQLHIRSPSPQTGATQRGRIRRAAQTHPYPRSKMI